MSSFVSRIRGRRASRIQGLPIADSGAVPLADLGATSALNPSCYKAWSSLNMRASLTNLTELIF